MTAVAKRSPAAFVVAMHQSRCGRHFRVISASTDRVVIALRARKRCNQLPRVAVGQLLRRPKINSEKFSRDAIREQQYAVRASD